MKEVELDGTCSIHKGVQKVIHNFCQNFFHLRDLGIERRVILKWFLEK